MKKIKEDTLLFSIGGTLYSLIEILYRGYTHWTMTITGGICLVLLYRIEDVFKYAQLWKRCLLGSFAITSMEFIVGCIVNLKLHWNVWDYSGSKMNVLGQICLPFSFAWFMLCIPGFFICDVIKIKLIPKIIKNA